MEHRLIKKIDKYEFELLYKWIEENYIKIKIKNISQQIDFIVYSSNSQGNTYRFCSLVSKDNPQLFKGIHDYVTETFIHMELQKFINENLNKLDIKPPEKCPLSIDNCDLNSDKTVISYKDYIEKRFVNFDTVDPFLNVIGKLKCGEGFERIYNVICNISDIYDIHEYLFSKSLFSIVISNAFDKLITDILLIFDKGKTGENRKEFIEILLKLREKGNSGLTPDNKDKLIKLYLEFISFYMNVNYEIKFDTKTFLYTTGKFFMKKVSSIKLNFNFFSVVIQNKVNKLEYTIIYAIYEYTNLVFRDYNGIYSIILNMIPNQDDGYKINSLGLYKKFSKVGIYICKPFDYSVQVDTLIRGSSPTTYYFIGNLYNDLFPVKQILEHIEL